MVQPVSVFYSYSHDDKSLLEQLQNHLANLRYRQFIDDWHDRNISPGVKWKHEICKRLETAQIILLLISSDFMKSHYCCAEMMRALKRHRDGEARVIPIMLRLCWWPEAPYEHLQVLPTNGTPITQWRDIDRAFTEVAQGIQSVVEELRQGTALTEPTIRTTANDSMTLSNMVRETGAMPADSRFYVVRHADHDAIQQLSSSEPTITVKGPYKSGKSSLLHRLHAQAVQAGWRSCYLDFQLLDRSCFESLDQLLRNLASEMSEELALDAEPDAIWSGHGSAPRKLTRFLDQAVLADTDTPVQLLFDEADRAFTFPDCCTALFAMIRSWHNRRARLEGWKPLRLVIAHSTDPALWISDLNQSPFNVGFPISLDDFDEQQVHDLNRRYGEPLQGEGDMTRLTEWVSGHPYLVRLALYTLATQRCSLEKGHAGRQSICSPLASLSAFAARKYRPQSRPTADHQRWHLSERNALPTLVVGRTHQRGDTGVGDHALSAVSRVFQGATMTTPGQPASDFYVVGGTMRPDAPSYVERDADQELFEHARTGDFCYVLTARQVGKSSLMIRTAKRLQQEEGVRTAIVDLTQIGTAPDGTSADQWYYGIAEVIVEELGLDVDLDTWWDQRKQLPALQRLMRFFRDIVLAQPPEQVVIFVDEIDSTIGLPFTDDFFAAIRACHNARANEPDYQRLSFVLLGVASPSDLIANTQRTPFNVGHRIDLTDFRREEARTMARGLSESEETNEEALQHILAWTGGHPYLTQKCCAAVTQNGIQNISANGIENVVWQTFLAPGAAHNDPNLRFVRERLVKFHDGARRLLALYRRIRQDKQVADNPLSPLHTALKLSGIVTSDSDGMLRIRNRIYELVFTDAWAKQAMPADWKRRVATAAVVLLCFLAVGWYEVIYPRLYISKLSKALDDKERRVQAARALPDVDYPHLLMTSRHDASVFTLAFSPDGNTLVTASGDGTARLWRVPSSNPLGSPLRHDAWVRAVAFSPDGNTLVTASGDSTARLWRVPSGKSLGSPLRHGDSVRAVAFSPDGNIVVTGSDKGEARLWHVPSAQPLGEPLKYDDSILAVAFSPDGQNILAVTQRWVRASSFDGQTIKDIASRMLPSAWKGPGSYRLLNETDASMGYCVQVAVLPIGNTLQIRTLCFDAPDAEP